MKTFHISDLLSVTTGRLVSSRHMDGIYDILNFLTGDDLFTHQPFTHQLPRAMRECKPWLATQFPRLMDDSPEMLKYLAMLTEGCAPHYDPPNHEEISRVCANWVEGVRAAFGLPEWLPVYEMGSDMHTHIDPVEEAKAMVGDDKVISVEIASDAE